MPRCDPTPCWRVHACRRIAAERVLARSAAQPGLARRLLDRVDPTNASVVPAPHRVPAFIELEAGDELAMLVGQPGFLEGARPVSLQPVELRIADVAAPERAIETGACNHVEHALRSPGV